MQISGHMKKNTNIFKVAYFKQFIVLNKYTGMAKSCGKVFLGFEDEAINDKNVTLLDYTVNKIGGYPVST